jgi:hypothetical protein
MDLRREQNRFYWRDYTGNTRIFGLSGKDNLLPFRLYVSFKLHNLLRSITGHDG